MPLQRTIQGIAVSPGLALGPVHVVQADASEVATWTVSEQDLPEELGRLADAVRRASAELERRQLEVAEGSNKKDAEIFAVHRMILQDPNSLRNVEKLITEQRINAEAAVQTLIDRFEKLIDVSDPWRHVLDALLERDREDVLSSDQKVILAAHELTPKVMTFLERERILGVAAETGGRFSHGAVLARAFGVPCVVGVQNLLARLEQGLLVTVDGDKGRVQLRPDQEQIDVFLERKKRLEDRREELRESAALPAVTSDGKSLLVLVNIESVRDLDNFPVEHTDGVGLFRTEFLYMERPEFPSEEEQYRLYRRVLQQMKGQSATMRTLDIGGDKPLPYFQTPKEPNPALGWRGIRITLQWSDLLRVQLRALLRASVHGSLRVLIPMVSSLEEIQEVHEVFDRVRTELVQQGYDVANNVPVGMMIEVPSVVIALDTIIDHVDFVSVGTNDLVQYLLAADRDNAWVSSLYDPQHPAVIRALKHVAEVSRAAGKPCSVCGDLAGDPATAVVLLGLGFDSISVAPHFVADIKFAVRNVTMTEAREFAEDALAQAKSSGIRDVLARVRSRLYDDRAIERKET
ncbi:MAG: phosphoenolpyruvate--protein phosphotransferase [Planctomycetota bacterium]|nr:phosphoenolpyruvate--protein phosphotransferase [Planctomycetota bacterium]